MMHRYYTLPTTSDHSPADVLHSLDEGVRKRLLADAPLCVLISGGLDSSAILTLAKKHKLTGTTNAMIAMRWYGLAIDANLREVAPATEAYLQTVGRTWLVTALFRAMVRSKDPFWQNIATQSYAKAKGHYHAMTRGPAEVLLKEIDAKP